MSQPAEEKMDPSFPVAAIDISRVLAWSGKNIRVFGTPEKPWFHGADLAKALGYTNVSKALTDHVKTKNKSSGGDISRYNESLYLDKYEKQAIFLDEGGLYSLIMKSKLAEAEAFQSWVTDEVLPSIRKTGTYKLNEQLQTIQSELTNQKLLTDQSVRIAEQAQARENEQKKIAEAAKAEADVARAKAEIEQKRADDTASDAAKAKEEHMIETQQLKDQIAPLQAAIVTIGESKEKWTKASAILMPPMENCMYIASSTSLMLKSRYKVGGVADDTKLAGRLTNYNGSHTAEDPFFYIWVGKCHDYRTIENAFWTITEGFRDKQDTSKEMIHLRFEHIISILSSTIIANTQNTEFFATQFAEFRRSTVEDTPTVQAKIEIQCGDKKPKAEKVIKPGKIDVGTMTTADIQAIIIARINEVARRTIADYTFATDRITKPIVIQWSDVSPNFDSYDKGALWWRGQTQTALAGSGVSLVIRKPKIVGATVAPAAEEVTPSA